jgi:hypothetical protein
MSNTGPINPETQSNPPAGEAAGAGSQPAVERKAPTLSESLDSIERDNPALGGFLKDVRRFMEKYGDR